MQRMGQIIGIHPSRIAEYKRLHADVWPTVLGRITACNIRNYSIFRHGDTLMAYFEYIGSDYRADAAKIAADPKMQEWWRITDAMQVPLTGHEEGAWWLEIPEVFHVD